MANESDPTQEEVGTPITEVIAPAGNAAVSEPLSRVVQRYRSLRANCETLMMYGAEMVPGVLLLDREIRQTLQTIADLPAHTQKDIQEKLDVLKSAHRWSGPDELLVPLALRVAEEAIGFFSCDVQDHNKSLASASGRNQSGTSTVFTAVA